jgi:hypothetical protein
MSSDLNKNSIETNLNGYPDHGVSQSEVNSAQLDPSEAIAVYRKIIAAKMGDIFSVNHGSGSLYSDDYNTEDVNSVEDDNSLNTNSDISNLDSSINQTAELNVNSSSYLIVNKGQQSTSTTGENNSNSNVEVKNKKKKTKKKNSQKLKLQIAHQTSGRVRMKIASAKGNPELLKKISETFGVIPGIERVSVNSLTGSIILHYDTDSRVVNEKLARSISTQAHSNMPGSEIDELARKIESEAEFLAQRSDAARFIVDLFKKLDKEIKIATHNMIDLKIVLAVGVIGLTVVEIGANAATPVWLTLAIFTFNHFVELRQSNEEDERMPVMAPVIFKHA